MSRIGADTLIFLKGGFIMTNKQKECAVASTIYTDLDKRRRALFRTLVDLAMILESMPPQPNTENHKETKTA